jgi:hypothetical protein
VVDSGIVGGVTGGAFSAPRGVKDTISATRFRDVGGDLQPASTALAERIRSRVGDDSELQSPQTAFRAVDEAKREVHNELKAAGANTTDPQVTNAIDRATSGRTLTGQDLAAIDKVGDPNLSMLARQAHVADVLTSKGNFDTGSATLRWWSLRASPLHRSPPPRPRNDAWRRRRTRGCCSHGTYRPR